MKTISDFPNYEIGYDGVVKSKLTGKVKSTRYAGKGYLVTDLYHNGKCKTSYIHRLVAEAFIDKTADEVNHIDGDKLNNYVSNLEWCSHKHNCVHKNTTGLGDRGVKKSCNTSGFIGVFKNGSKWIAKIRVNNIDTYLGSYYKKEDAAKAYDEGSIKYHGDSGKRNFNEVR